jgi:hypothetical protein
MLVRDPVTRRPLDPEGEDKPRYGHEMYWQRRLRDGDVVEVAKPDDEGETK